MSWFNLTRRKEERGMSFKDFHIFNKASLAKQSWRVLNNENAFWVKVLKGIYFPNCSFFEAKKGEGPLGHGQV